MNNPTSHDQATTTVDLSPGTILSCLKMVDELNQLCRILGETGLPGKTTDLMVAESPAANQPAIASRGRTRQQMKSADMSPEAIAARLQQLSELYDLSLMLRSAKKVDQSDRLPESTAQTRHVDQGDPAST